MDEIKIARKRRANAKKREDRRLREPMSDDTRALIVIVVSLVVVGLLIGGFAHLAMWILQ